MPSTYIPTREGDLDNWLNNFQAKISDAPASYGLSAGDAAEITASYDAWQAAFAEALSPTTRTRGHVHTKNQRKREVLAVVRSYAAEIRANPDIPRELKIGLGLHVRPSGDGARIGGGGSPIAAPQAAPAISLIGMRQGSHTLRVTDASVSGRRAKPRGTAGLLLFRAVADAPTLDPEEARFLAFVTRPEHQTDFRSEDRGRIATYFARWTNLKGELGPWSRATSMSIAV